jgi:hypothetical protein
VGIAPVVSLAPAEPNTGDRLQVELVSPAVLASGEAPAGYRYRWWVDGEERVEFITDSVSSIFTAKGERWEVGVSAFEDSDWEGTASVLIVNTAPSLSISLDPAEPSTNDAVSVIAETSDADGDSVSLSYVWTKNGVETTGIGWALSPDLTEIGDTWSVAVTPDDGEMSGEPRSASFSVVNSPPSVQDIEILPIDPVTDSLLSVTVTVVDPDGDEVTLNYRWRVNGSTVQDGTEETLESSFFVKWNFIDVFVTPDDGLVSGGEFQSGVIFIQNTPPEILGVTLSPENPTSSDTVMAIADGYYDADGDPVMYSVIWYVNNVSIPAAIILTGANFDRGDEIYAEMQGYDMEDSGPSELSPTVIIANALPAAPDIAITPASPTVDDDLSCSIETDSTDAEGDSISYAWSWWVDGVDSGKSKETLKAAKTSEGEEWTCRVVPNDGFGDGAAAEVSVDILP